MHAIVLAGGYATRLWPITLNRPKMLLPIGDQTVIGTVLDPLENDDRVDDVYVSTNEKFAETFETYLDASSYEKPQLSIEETTAESEKFGVVGALAQLVNRENLTEDTLVIAGDNLICFDVSDFIDMFQTFDTPTLAAYDVGDRQKAKSYGLLNVDGNEVVDFQEKPNDPKSTLVSIACYGLPAETLPKLETYLNCNNNPDEPGWFIQWLQDRETVRAYTFEEEWFDIGTPESYLDAIAWYLDGKNYVHPSAELVDTEVGENVQIMADAALEDMTVTDSVVFPESTLTECEIQRSLVDEDTYAESITLSGAVIGAHTHLSGD